MDSKGERVRCNMTTRRLAEIKLHKRNPHVYAEQSAFEVFAKDGKVAKTK